MVQAAIISTDGGAETLIDYRTVPNIDIDAFAQSVANAANIPVELPIVTDADMSLVNNLEMATTAFFTNRLMPGDETDILSRLTTTFAGFQGSYFSLSVFPRGSYSW